MLKSSSPMFGKREEPQTPAPVLNPGQSTSSSSRPNVPNTISAAASSSTQSAAAEKEKAAEPAGNRLIVGPDVRLKGAEILDCDTLVVEGYVEATMDSRIIRIAEKGEFNGKVGIDVAEIHGTFNGELEARNQLIIHATGRVNGKVRYGKVLIEEGGELSGDVQMLSAAEQSMSHKSGGAAQLVHTKAQANAAQS